MGKVERVVFGDDVGVEEWERTALSVDGEIFAPISGMDLLCAMVDGATMYVSEGSGEEGVWVSAGWYKKEYPERLDTLESFESRVKTELAGGVEK